MIYTEPDDDTISLLIYIADSIEQLPLGLLLPARTQPLLCRPAGAPAVRQLPLSRLTPTEVGDALGALELPGLAAETAELLKEQSDVTDGCPQKFEREEPRLGH